MGVAPQKETTVNTIRRRAPARPHWGLRERAESNATGEVEEVMWDRAGQSPG